MHKILFKPWFLLIIIISTLYYKFFLLLQIPFPGDLLIGSYFPWLDYFKMPVKNPLISDVFSQFFLWKYLAIESIKSFHWPLWNPYSFMGNPLLATYHSAVLYPVNILLLLPKYYGWALFIYSQTLIASLTFYLFISLFTKSNIAKFSGAVIYSLGGLMTTWLELGTAVHAMAWLPLALYAVQKFLDKLQFRFILLLILSLSLIVLSGNVQVTTYSYITIFLYGILVSCRKKAFYRNLLFLSIALILSISITALQILPSYDLLQKSIRQTESYSAEENFGLLNRRDLFKFFIADYFGNPVTRNYWGDLNYSETSPFLGTLTLSLLIYSVIKVKTKESKFFLLLLIASLILAFDNSLSRFLYQIKIPLLTSSYASRMLFMTILSSAILAALALNHAIKNNNFTYFFKISIWSWASIFGVILGTLLVKFIIWSIIDLTPSDVRYINAYSNSRDYTLNNFDIAIKNSLVPFAILSLFIFLSFLTRKVRLMPFLIFLFLFFDLGRYFLKFNPFVTNHLIFPKTPALEFLQKQEGFFRVGREHAEILPPNTWATYNLYSYEGYDPIYLNRYGQFVHFLNGGDLRTGNSTRYAEISSNYSSPYLDAANAKYFVAIFRDQKGRIPEDLPYYKVKETGYKLVFRDKSTAVLENPDAVDRVYFAKEAIFSNDQEIKNKMMTDKSFDPRTTLLLSKDLGISSVTGKGKAEITQYSENEVKIKTQTNSDEVLVLADQFEEGWVATIDGNETTISPANLIFRAIKLSKGNHEVILKYTPKSFNIGLKISLITILLTSLIALVAMRNKKF